MGITAHLKWLALLGIYCHSLLLCNPREPLAPERPIPLSDRTVKQLINTKHPLLSTKTPLSLKEHLLWSYGLADASVAQWVEAHIKERAHNVNKLLVLVGSVSVGSATTYLVLHQANRIHAVVLGQEDHQIVQRYLTNSDTTDPDMLLSICEIKAKLDRVAHQLAQYRTFYSMLATGAATLATMSASTHWALQHRNRDPSAMLLPTFWASVCGLILLSRYWVTQDDAAISDDIDVLEGFKAHLEELRQDAYRNPIIRLLFSSWYIPSPESRLASIQERINALRRRQAVIADI